MSTSERRRQARQTLRDRILAAARELFVGSGYEAVTMRKIAERINYSPTTIYLHFKDKQSLVAELSSEALEALAIGFRAIPEERDPLARIKAVGMAFIDFGLKHPNHYRMMFMTSHPPVPAKARRIRPGNLEEDAWAVLVADLTEAQAAGLIPRTHGEPNVLAQQCLAAMHGVLSLHFAKGNDPWIPWMPVREAGERMLDTLIRGLATPGSLERPSSAKRRKPSRRTP